MLHQIGSEIFSRCSYLVSYLGCVGEGIDTLFVCLAYYSLFLFFFKISVEYVESQVSDTNVGHEPKTKLIGL